MGRDGKMAQSFEVLAASKKTTVQIPRVHANVIHVRSVRCGGLPVLPVRKADGFLRAIWLARPDRICKLQV